MAVLILTILPSCSDGEGSGLSSNSDQGARRSIDTPHSYSTHEIEALARLKLPPEAKILSSHIESGGLDGLVALLILLPKKQFSSFMSQAGYETNPEPVNYVSSLFVSVGREISGWPNQKQWDDIIHKGQLTIIRGAEPGFSRTTIIDQSGADEWRLYVIHHEL
ncbi:hypothetical protein ONV78_29620 [Hahella sp. CR1]|uniref:hypothetical protein n=1 Tax=Hahella sp. CR1 TaxID=2992807 RepID=UPI002442FAF8|nr:hypothetical protein [Hahella sp. CR1]MDG9671929.1 hypothetical protein [Hahella sp. CR1]